MRVLRLLAAGALIPAILAGCASSGSEWQRGGPGWNLAGEDVTWCAIGGAVAGATGGALVGGDSGARAGAAAFGLIAGAIAGKVLCEGELTPKDDAVVEASSRFIAQGGRWQPSPSLAGRIRQAALGELKCKRL